MSKLLNLALAAALGFAVSTPLYAADTRSTAWSDAEVRTAMDKCKSLTGTAKAKCIVNIRPTVARAPGDSTNSSADEHTVKDGTAATEAEYAAAVKECESRNAADKDRCINTAKEHFGRM